MGNFKNIFFVFPVMFYYLIEAVVVAGFITLLSKLFLSDVINIGYLQWVTIYWIVKMLFFDVFKLVTAVNAGNTDDEDYDPDNLDYNENITP